MSQDSRLLAFENEEIGGIRCEIEQLKKEMSNLRSQLSKLAPDAPDQSSSLFSEAEVPSLESEKKDIPNPLAGDVPVTYITMKAEGQSERYKELKGTRPSDFESAEDGQTDEIYTMKFISYDSVSSDKSRTVIEIYSHELIDAMRGIMSPMINHIGPNLWQKSPISLDTKSPYLFYSLESLRQAAKGTELGDKCRRELLCFLNHYNNYEAESIKALESVMREGKISFNMIWTLFPYGSRVIANPFKNSPQVFHVQQHSKEESTLGSNTNFVLICWTYDWDGSGLVRHVFDFRIPKYEGFKSIPELPCCPIKLYCQDGVSGRDLEQTLTERGKLFRQRCIPNHMVAQPVYRTDSFVLFPKTSGELFPSSDSQGDIEFSDSDAFSMSVILDSTLCKLHSTGIHSMGKFHPNSFGRLISVPRAHCKCQLCDNDGQYSLFEESFRGPGGDDSIANEMSMLLPPRLHAFVLDVKKWAQVLVNNLKETNDINNEEGWKKLALDDDHKRNIRAMVTSHFDRERRKIAKDDGGRDIHDFTHGKGEGLVIFLHGVPGVGKTMTAETLSLALKRPLLRIDASDLEHKNPNQVSEVFKRRFEMSSSWGALLLLDEADVFLQDRKRSEIDQNALVSVLLRELEYFRGVLIMTTNRPVTMDPAVRSRIHYAVRYKELNEVNIGKVWNTFFDQLNDTNCVPGERENIRKWFEDGGARTLARSKFTGRDVRNLFIGAQLLSYPMITRNNIKKVRQSICDFTADMAKVYHPKIQKNTAAGDDSD